MKYTSVITFLGIDRSRNDSPDPYLSSDWCKVHLRNYSWMPESSKKNHLFYNAEKWCRATKGWSVLFCSVIWGWCWYLKLSRLADLILRPTDECVRPSSRKGYFYSLKVQDWPQHPEMLQFCLWNILSHNRGQTFGSSTLLSADFL